MDKYNFQYCQKIVVFSGDLKSVLLCRRKDEKDYNGIFSFIGGKMEITDQSLLAGLKREKNEELGEDFKMNINLTYSTNIFFIKKDGSRMILPHYYAIYSRGEIKLSNEYSEYKWVVLDDLENFCPKIESVSKSVRDMQALMRIQRSDDLVEI